MSTTAFADETIPILARHFHARLPRELRDLVYSYLWDGDAMRKMNAPLLLCQASPPFNILPGTSIPHFTRPSCVGAAVSHEAVEWLYKNGTDFSVDAEDLGTFLHLDIFGFGFTPANSRIRRLAVNVDLTNRDVFPTLPSEDAVADPFRLPMDGDQTDRDVSPALGYEPSRDAVEGPFRLLMDVDLGKDFRLVVRLAPLWIITILTYPLVQHARLVLERTVHAFEQRGMAVELWYGERDVKPVLGNLNDWWCSLCDAPDRPAS
ncbi:hypothetical protein K505DRAFT_419671 [Melanomma pulvis-pyrius CBS 109.77]|uniref:Uncharacterized protein n=1 Tax=Melanomma pulvis-pyrius CBS 109.77 TaxID=1314802 RepID=A0A6A6X387_9PLEO|nr:hypothetical protein K505DRAFT_419671 [Melanomma pulvis-pyrius CBS 109.77]